MDQPDKTPPKKPPSASGVPFIGNVAEFIAVRGMPEEAARNVTFVEIPALEGGYSAFYNPGEPGPEPFEGVRYTAPGPPDLEPVMIALDDPMRVDRTTP